MYTGKSMHVCKLFIFANGQLAKLLVGKLNCFKVFVCNFIFWFMHKIICFCTYVSMIMTLGQCLIHSIPTYCMENYWVQLFNNCQLYIHNSPYVNMYNHHPFHISIRIYTYVHNPNTIWFYQSFHRRLVYGPWV